MAKRLLMAFTCLLMVQVACADDWMARLDDHVFVDQLSIPGTHDAGTGHGFDGGKINSSWGWLIKIAGPANYGKTQDKNIGEQWDSGIRAFDLRPCVNGSSLHIYHGILGTKINFHDALAIIRDKVIEHPTEFAIVMMRHEIEGDNNNDTWGTKMYELLSSDEFRPYLAIFKPDLTVKDLRGKILLLSRDNYASQPLGGYVNGVSDAPELEEQKKGEVSSALGSTKLCHQDYYNTSGTNGKQIKTDAITALLDYSTTQSKKSDASHIWFINNTSGYSKVFSLGGENISTADGYRDNAATQNAAVIAYLAEHHGPTGIMFMDFAGTDKSDGTNVMSQSLTNAIIENNFSFDPEVSYPARLSLARNQQNYGTQYGTIVPVDLCNQGKQNLIIGAYHHYNSEEPRWNIILQTKGNVAWSELPSNLNIADRPSITPCDINGDGTMDLVVFETLGRRADDNADLLAASTQGIFLGNGDGTFTEAPFAAVRANAGLPAHYSAPFGNLKKIMAGAVADFNNDGQPDIVGVGTNENNVVLINRGDMRFQPYYFDDGTEYDGTGHDFECAVVFAADFNNDGYADILISANKNNGPNTGHDRERFMEVYLNNGTGTKFVRTHWGDTCPSVADGGVAIADFNNDGYLDIFCQGPGGFWPGTDFARNMTGNDEDGYWDHTYVCLNDGTGHFSVVGTDLFDRLDLRNQNSTTACANAYDWDGDGNIDIIYQGWCPSLSKQTGYIWMNKGGANFSRDYRFAAGSEAATCLVDWNNDGKKDIVSTGFTQDDKYLTDRQKGRIMTITYDTQTASNRLGVPRNLQAEVNGQEVTLSWEAPTNAPKNTTYELYIETEDGTLLGNCRAFTSGANNGLRKCEDFGNLGCVRRITYTLPEGNYTWGVQAVNGRRIGSRFATGTFSNVTTGISLTPLTPSPKGEGETYTSIYTLQGTRINSMKKGIYIVNGKKVVVK